MTTCWNIDEHDFPRHGTPQSKLQFVLQYATLAPSSHNSQPWRFMLAGRQVTLLADRPRALPVVDPHDRELTISCGAALMNLCVALAYFGQGFSIDPFPADAEPDVLAVLHMRKDLPAQEALAHLFHGICARATNRGPFEDAPVPPLLCAQLAAQAEAEGVTLAAITDAAQRANVAQLITEADVAQFADARFRRELASWIHGTRSFDGMPGQALGLPDLLGMEAPVAGMILRTFDVGNGVAARDSALAAGSPLLVCLATAQDRPVDWLCTGMALERVLLWARLEGYDASYLNQPVEMEYLRGRLRAMLGLQDTPQLLLRLGQGLPVDHTPRRPLSEVLL
jgi:hypothetical protein